MMLYSIFGSSDLSDIIGINKKKRHTFDNLSATSSCCSKSALHTAAEFYYYLTHYYDIHIGKRLLVVLQLVQQLQINETAVDKQSIF